MRRQRILIADDMAPNRDLLKLILNPQYDVLLAVNGQEAVDLALGEDPPDLVILDIDMPVMDGYEACKLIKDSDSGGKIPVLFVTALESMENERRGLELGAVDYITKPFTPALVKARVRNHLSLKNHQDQLEELVRERTEQIYLLQQVMIESLATLAEYRDPETGGHINRTQSFVKALALKTRDHPEIFEYLDDKTIELFYRIAPLHDVGKVGVPDAILLKPGPLDDDEWEEMKKHTIYGRDAIRLAEKKLGSQSFLKIAEEFAYCHHEKWNGEGYPEGLSGEEIPLSGRLMAVADVYDALISRRIYKPPMPHYKAVEIIRAGRGTHFDPNLVDIFLEIEEAFRQIAIEFADFDEERELLKGSRVI